MRSSQGQGGPGLLQACMSTMEQVYSTAPACWAGSLHLDTESCTPWLQVTMVVCNWVHASNLARSHARHCLTQSLHATLLPWRGSQSHHTDVKPCSGAYGDLD